MSFRILLTLGLYLCCSIYFPLTAQKTPKIKVVLTDTLFCPNTDYEYVYGDEFDNVFDTSKWYTFFPYGPSHALDSCAFCRTHVASNVFVDENVYTSGGYLYLKTAKKDTSWFGKTYSFTAGMIQSKQSFTDYAKYEMRFKLREGVDQAPAFWIFGWNTEIDIFEFSGYGPYRLEFSIHKWLTPYCPNKNPKKGKPCYSNRTKLINFGIDFSKEFYTLGVEYTPIYIRFLLNDIPIRHVARYYTSKKQPIHSCPIPPGTYYEEASFPIPGEPVQIIANEGITSQTKESSISEEAYMLIDWIRVWQRKYR